MHSLVAFWFVLCGATGVSWFDFSQNQIYQSGGYASSTEVTITGNAARLATHADWHAPAWAYRFEVLVQNTSPTLLSHYPVRVDLRDVPSELFDLAAVDGHDIQLYDAGGNMVSTLWLESFDFIAR